MEELRNNRDFELNIPGIKYAHIMRKFENVLRRGERVELAKIVATGMT